MLSAFSLLSLATYVLAKTQFAGVNIAGLEFGCGEDGTCDINSVVPPLTTASGPDGIGQIQHFVTNDQLNMFRLPVGWQYLVDNTLGGTLDATNFGIYDQLLQGCLATGAYCVIDIHNYARWNGKIIGQDAGGPTNAQFSNLWSQIAMRYQNTAKVVFGIMNEPHDLNITIWSATVQEAVTAIRAAGASKQMILLPGTNFTSASSFVDSGSADALALVKNPDGSNTNLVFDVHKYLDVDSTGTHAECVTNGVDDTFVPLAAYLKKNGRQAILSETGGGNTASCLTDLCAELTYLNANPDVFLGYISWAAGSFNTTYLLSEVPTLNLSGKYADNSLTSQCVVGTRVNQNATANGTGTVTGTGKKSDAHALVPSFTTLSIILTSLMAFAL